MRWGTMGWDRMGKKGGEVEWKGDRTIEEREREREREKRYAYLVPLEKETKKQS